MKLLGCSLALAAALAAPADAQTVRSTGQTDVFLNAIHPRVQAALSEARLTFVSVGDELSAPRGIGWSRESVGQSAADPPRTRPDRDPPRVWPQPDGPPGSSGGGNGGGARSVGGGDPPLTPVPEPATMLLMAAGLFAIGGVSLLRRRAR